MDSALKIVGELVKDPAWWAVIVAAITTFAVVLRELRRWRQQKREELRHQAAQKVETINAALRSARKLAFVWVDNFRILGFVCAHALGFRAYLSELVVDMGVQQQGIGTRLVRAVEEALRDRGRRILIATFGAMRSRSIDHLGGNHPMSFFSGNDWNRHPDQGEAPFGCNKSGGLLH